MLSDDTVKEVDASNLTRSAATTSFKKATRNDHDAESKYNLEYCATKRAKAMGSSPVVSQEAGCDVQAALEACVTAKDAKRPRLKKVSSNQPQGGIEPKKRGIVKAIVFNFVAQIIEKVETNVSLKSRHWSVELRIHWDAAHSNARPCTLPSATPTSLPIGVVASRCIFALC